MTASLARERQLAVIAVLSAAHPLQVRKLHVGIRRPVQEPVTHRVMGSSRASTCEVCRAEVAGVERHALGQDFGIVPCAAAL